MIFQIKISPYVVPGLRNTKITSRDENVQFIKYNVCKVQSITFEELHSKSNKNTITKSKYLCYYFIRKKTNASLLEIGQYFGKKEHTSVLWGLQQIKNLIDAKDEIILNSISQIEKSFINGN